MISLYVDADACPVKQEVIRVAQRHKIKTYIVCNGGIRPDPNPLVETVVVAQGADAADDWIAEHIGAGDICITSDIPLADRCLKAGGRAMKPDGDVWTSNNIGNALAMRELMSNLREANPLAAGGGGKSFTAKDRSRFLDVLEREVRAG